MAIEDKLSGKDPVLICVFCLLAVERLLGIYEAFSERFSMPIREFKDVLEKAYVLVFSSNKDELINLTHRAEGFIPDSDDYSDVVADQAQCTAICMSYALDYILENDSSLLEYVFQKVGEAIDILGYEGGDDEGALNREEKWQAELLEKLTRLSELNRESIRELENQNKNYSIPHV